MSFEPPAGILDIGNATLRVGKLEVAETSGLNQGLQNIVKNDLLITETAEYTTNQTWGLKLPTAWVADFDIKGGTGKYVEFNFYNEGSTSNAQGYTLHFEDTTLTLKYDNGSTLASATIPTIVGTYRKVNIFFERNVVAVSIDGTRYLYDKRPSVLSRVISTTGSAFLNTFFESDHGGNSGFKNLRIVNGRFISDKTSNVSFIGSLGVGVNSPTESLDVLGNIKTTANVHAGGEIELYSNLNIQHVSNTSTIQANSNVVTEFPRSKKLIKYPRVALTSEIYNGYIVTSSDEVNAGSSASWQNWKAFGNFFPADAHAWLTQQGTYPATAGDAVTSGTDTNGDSLPKNLGTDSGGPATANGSWLKLKLPHKITLQFIKMTANDVVAPDDFDVLGSNDDTNWSLLGSFTTPNPVVYTRLDQYDINAVTSYLYYAVIIKSHRGSNHTYSGIYTLEYYGVPEYDPDAHGTDVTVKSYPNVPNTDWLEVYYDAKGLATGAVTTVNDLKPSSLGSAINSSSTNNITVADDAFVFNGTDSYIKINDLTNPSGAWIHSVVAWVKFTDFDSSQEVSWIGDADGAAIRQSFSFQTGGETVTMGISGSNVQFRFTSPLSAGKWHHVVYTYNGGQAGSTSTAYQVFIDGVEASKFGGSGSGTLTLPAGSALWFGRNHGGTNHFGGSIANFRLFNRALTSDEIWQLYSYQKEYFGHGDLSMTLKAGRLGIGTSEPRAALDVRGDANLQSTIYGPLSTFETVNFTSIYATTWTSTQGANETELVLLTATVKVPDIYKHLGKHQLKIYYTWHWVGEAGRYDPGTTTLDTDGGGYYFFQFRTRTSHNGTVQNMHAGNVSSIIKVVSPIAVSLPNNDHSTLDQSVIPGIFTLTDAFAGDDITIDLTGVWTSDAYGQVRTNRTMQDGNSSSYERGVTTLCVWFKPII